VVEPGLFHDVTRALEPGGEILVETDVFDLALEAMSIAEGSLGPDLGQLVNLAGPWSFMRASPFAARSRRARQCEALGETVWRLCYRKGPSPRA
jgi:tRNA G46 methylase TrmB